MITLHQPPPVWGLPNMSPFCVKLETYLRMAKIPYENKFGVPQKGPKGRIPYAVVDGKVMGDSSHIIRELKRLHGDPLDADLSAEQRAQALALQALVEDRLYFASAWLRWADDASFKHVAKVFEPMIPGLVRAPMLKMIRKGFLKAVSAQGIGEHSREEILSIACDALSAISALLGDRQFFFGTKPTSTDAMLYGFLVQALWVPWEGELKTHARSLPNLEPYCERMKKIYWS